MDRATAGAVGTWSDGCHRERGSPWSWCIFPTSSGNQVC